jgi:hypothetical protein
MTTHIQDVRKLEYLLVGVNKIGFKVKKYPYTCNPLNDVSWKA